MGFGDHLGVIINMKDLHWPEDEHFDRWLRQDPEHRCFQQSIPRVTPLQGTGFVSPQTRSYWAKYPGETGDQLRHLTLELLGRLSTAQGNTVVAETAPRVEMPEHRLKHAEGKMKAMWTTWRERKML
jgi:chromosome partitioning protein